ncbi:MULTISPECIES: MBL fold metallo-hydrolase [Actinopolyspora]|uniref:Glyoxylase, beta-lactamase superfamily II n=1 Tax=Actinopolyspora saharensis TaxID=995062 RepID=A0A1H1DK18_9ACTN|nr:MBL fold metallo-hydrolase [Actinopolyspora saharensis]SDQ76855.1 Glyoxylase, beta-lactamase superfamily II [Actinopolyspora saharensis]
MTGEDDVRWRELADGVLIRRYAELDLTVGLVLGDQRALVIDARGDRAQGAELAGAVRAVTALPWQLVLTHAHFDHCFGAEAFAPAPCWAHVNFPRHLSGTVEFQRAEWIEHYRASGDRARAEALAATEVRSPERLVADSVELDLGNRTVRLEHPGPGHTDHDLTASVREASVLFAGDLLESGAAPDFGDALPLDWPDTVGRALHEDPALIVAGHGEPMTRRQAAEQHAELRAVAELCAAHSHGGITTAEAVERGPYPPETMRTALERANRR